MYSRDMVNARRAYIFPDSRPQINTETIILKQEVEQLRKELEALYFFLKIEKEVIPVTGEQIVFKKKGKA